MMRFSLLFTGWVLFYLLAVPCYGEQVDTYSHSELEKILHKRIQGLQILARNPVIVRAVRRQNALKQSLEEIQQIDEAWRAGNSPMIKKLQETQLGMYLQKIVMNQSTSYSEIFITDDQGANVAMYPTTSDYWQGDEDKFIECFNDGTGSIFIGEPEFDESTQTNAVQVSIPVFDQYGRNETIGVMVVGITLKQVEADKLGLNLEGPDG